MNRVTRRKFIQVATAAAAGSMVCCTNRKSTWRFFTLEEGQTADAICDRLIPEDQDPGASQVGVVNFIDIQLMGPYKRFRSSYRQGLKGIDQASRQTYGQRFTELSAEKQDAVLKELERGGATGEAWKEISSKYFCARPWPHDARLLRRSPARGKPRANELENGRLALPAHSRAVALRPDEWADGQVGNGQMGKL